jgi:VWFA-related protein
MPASPLNRRVLLASLAFLPAAWRRIAGQQPTFSAGVKVVNVLATVRDRQGQIVKNLRKEDFTLLEDGRPQVIRYFAQQSDLPLTLGLLVDTSYSERRMIPTERTASHKFLEQVLRPQQDKAFLIHFGHDVELLLDLTSSRERLEKALDELQVPEHQGRSRQSGGGTRHMGGGTAFYDSIYLAAGEILRTQPGRKALIMLTDGEDNASKISVEEAISAAERADTLGYAVRISDEEIGSMVGAGWHGPRGAIDRPDGKKILKQIAKETGGGYFEFGKKKSLEDIYSEIEEELRNQYGLGYTSDKPGDDAGFRKIELKAANKGLVVQTRSGYYA